jgi:hypothetical protein
VASLPRAEHRPTRHAWQPGASDCQADARDSLPARPSRRSGISTLRASTRDPRGWAGLDRRRERYARGTKQDLARRHGPSVRSAGRGGAPTADPRVGRSRPVEHGWSAPEHADQRLAKPARTATDATPSNASQRTPIAPGGPHAACRRLLPGASIGTTVPCKPPPPLTGNRRVCGQLSWHRYRASGHLRWARCVLVLPRATAIVPVDAYRRVGLVRSLP